MRVVKVLCLVIVVCGDEVSLAGRTLLESHVLAQSSLLETAWSCSKLKYDRLVMVENLFDQSLRYTVVTYAKFLSGGFHRCNNY